MNPKIILTASEVEMCDFGQDPFIAFGAGFPTTFFFLHLVDEWLSHPGTVDGIRARLAPYGLRKVEAALLEYGFDEKEVAVVHPKELPKAVGDQTRVVGISSMDPLGYAFVSLTYSALVGGSDESWTAKYFRKLMNNKYIKKIPVKILGGAGAWQVDTDIARTRLGINTVIVGEGLKEVPSLFEKAVKGESIPKSVHTKQDPLVEVPTIRGASINGTVRITRGCGRGCHFCTPTMRKRDSVPLEQIIAEAKVQAAYGYDMITLVTDDFFLYKLDNPKFIPNHAALVELFTELTKIKEIRYIQPAHAALAPVIVGRKTFEEIADITYGYGRYGYRGKNWMAVEVGLESGSPRLMSEHMNGKSIPLDIMKWQEIVEEATGIMNDNGWLPLGTIIVGMPGENEDDVLKTLELIDRLRKYVIFFVPLLFTPLHECVLRNERRADLRKFSESQWEVFNRAWNHNIHTWREDWLGPLQNNIFINAFRKIGGAFAWWLYYRWGARKNIKKLLLSVTGWYDKKIDDYFKKVEVGKSLMERLAMKKSTSQQELEKLIST
ncbi:MAG: radical SAM protein [Candidatus Korarchaeota archaeon]